MSSETYNIINLALNALTSVGTLAAVVVALYLARQDRRDFLKASADIGRIGSMGQSLLNGQEVVRVDITNLGKNPITITGFGWQIGIIRKKRFFQIHDPFHPCTSKLPQKLEYGDTASYPLDTAKWFKEFGEIGRHISLLWPWLTKRHLKLIVFTSSSKRPYRSTLNCALADRFIEEARKQRVSNQSAHGTR